MHSIRTWTRFVVVSGLTAFAVSAPGAPAARAGSAEGIPAFGHVFVIVGENTTYSHVKPTNMPYLFHTLKPRSAWMTEYRGTTHWSQANYVAMTSGQFTKCEQQDYGVSCHQDVNNLFHQLDVAGRTWTTWLEGRDGSMRHGFREPVRAAGPVPADGVLHDR